MWFCYEWNLVSLLKPSFKIHFTSHVLHYVWPRCGCITPGTLLLRIIHFWPHASADIKTKIKIHEHKKWWVILIHDILVVYFITAISWNGKQDGKCILCCLEPTAYIHAFKQVEEKIKRHSNNEVLNRNILEPLQYCATLNLCSRKFNEIWVLMGKI